jgi:thiamine biosynthesis lipoprotein
MKKSVADLSLLLVTVALLFVAGCGREPIHREESYVFGTLVEVIIYGEPEARAREAAGRVLREFDRLNRTFHAWRPSPLTELNAAFAEGRETEISPELAQAIADARHYWQRSDGLFNPAIGRLIALWGFQADEFRPVRPDPAAISALVAARPGMGDIVIEGNRARSRNRFVKLDFGGYAKGLALDLASRELKKAGIRNALINIGGNILALGRKGDRPWHVGIQHPRRAGPVAELDLLDGEAIGTSGDYQRYFELDGRRFCHIIDPRTGWPAQGVQAVTVLVAPGPHAGVLSDVASKPLFIAKAAGMREMAEKMQVRDVLLIDAEGKITVTASFARRLKFAPDTPPPRIVP